MGTRFLSSNKNRNKHKGFTLAEVLIVVAIIVILFAIAVPAVITIRKNLRQKELDSKAETIYMAVQNRMSKMRAAGNTDIFQPGKGNVKKLGYLPEGEEEMTEDTLYYFTSADLNNAGTASNTIVTEDVMDESLRSHNWVIEYDPSSCTVYGVFYNENSDKVDMIGDYTDRPSSYEYMRSKSTRLSEGAWVGYYGGGTSSSADTTTLTPSVYVINNEKLAVEISQIAPYAMTKKKLTPTFKITLTDDAGHTAEVTYNTTAIDKSANTYTYLLVLDDLTSGSTRFHALFPDLNAGTKLTITVEAQCRGFTSIPVTRYTNSLFADKDDTGADAADGTALIAYGRHLENLDSASGVSDTVKAAVQIAGINFTETTDSKKKYKTEMDTAGTKAKWDCWKNTYGTDGFFNGYFNDTVDAKGLKDPNFKAISNANLMSFNGKSLYSDTQYSIENLKVTAAGAAGLFEDFGKSGTTGDPATIAEVRLVDPSIETTGDTANAGTLIAAIPEGAAARITDISVEKTNADKTAAGSAENAVITAEAAGNYGGLVGLVDSNANASIDTDITLTSIDIAFAKTNTVSGGLVGRIGSGASVTVSDDVTLTGTKIAGTDTSGTVSGGLVGLVEGADLTTDRNVQVYLTSTDISVSGVSKTNFDTWISGETAGGLIGCVRNSAVSLTKSSASTTVGAYTEAAAAEAAANGKITTQPAFLTTAAGGLIGTVDSAKSVKISSSYADCYLAGVRTGGLVGESNMASGSLSVDSSYAAGFYTCGRNSAGDSAYAAGLVGGAAAISNSYTILCSLYMSETELPYYQTAVGSYKVNNVYYSAASNSYSPETQAIEVGGEQSISWDVTSPTELTKFVAALNGSSSTGVFALPPSSKAAYNLVDLGLSTYTYPVIDPETSTFAPYGDWKASFETGALVYYECYKDADGKTSYGFYGADVTPSLKDDADLTVIGDGYGLVYQQGDPIAASIEISLEGTGTGNTFKNTFTINTTSAASYSVTSEGINYKIYAFPAEVVNAAQNWADYYLKATIAGQKSYYFNPYFAKTVQAIKAESAEVPALTAKTPVSVRTARHIYMMSLYYEKFAEATKLVTFQQERNIDYTAYGWSTYSTRSDKDQNPRSQEPIAGDSVSFMAAYDGGYHWITDVSFAANANQTHVGFIGSNAGTVSNVVLRATYNTDGTENYCVSYPGTIDGEICIGVLVGENQASQAVDASKKASVSNCAVSGYYIAGAEGTIFAYENSMVYAGGLVGKNSGVIANCSADTPTMSISSTYANVFAGGFAGSNAGTIQNSYALGSINVTSRGGSVSMSGFAGENGSGSITDSYCATALTASGETSETHGFANGGYASGCTYLDGGTFSYIGHLYSFNFTESATIGTSTAYNKLTENSQSAILSYDFNNTTTASEKYPFRAVVIDGAGNYVHYGNWLDDENMGTFGIFYWEHEENGENNGYHFTYIGTLDGKATGGTSLCNAHDDGGIITEYGYGYFELNAGTVTSLTVSGAVIGGSSTWTYGDTKYNKTASKALSDQMHYTDANGTLSNFKFYAFTTRTEGEAGSDGDYICMSDSSANSTWTLHYKLASTGAAESTVQYTVCPFFANAMQANGVSSAPVTGNDGNVTDYGKTPGLTDGNEGNPYEIRSIRQLQFINWREDQSSFTDTSSEGTEAHFLYECKTDKKYSQSHDVENTTDSDGNSTKFYPLGRAGRSFKEHYNGNSYQIRNLYIDESTSSYVGLFGEIGGEAYLQNMILTADPGKGIIRSTYYANSTNNSSNNYREPAVGAFGGLIWTKTNSTVMKNCAASGYTIEYAGTVVSGFYRYISMGGLVASVFGGKVENCQASNTIQVAGMTNGIRQHLGGLIGSAGNAANGNGQYAAAIVNCYSGGEIITNNTNNVLCGGLVGNGKAHTSNTGDGGIQCSITNCYTFCSIISSTVSGMTGYHYLYGNTASMAKSYFLKGSNADNSATVQNDNGLTYTQMSDGTLLGYLSSYKPADTGHVSSIDAGYHNVTTTEGNNVTIDGKYSYPSSSRLEGKNYPFPEIIEQKDLIYSSSSSPVYVYVHYGDWRIDGAYWENGRDTMDIFSDMQKSGDSYTTAEKVFKLYTGGKISSKPELASFEVGNKDIAKVVSVGDKESDSNGDYYPVTVRALNKGFTTIKCNYTTDGTNASASMTLEVTANLALKITGDDIIMPDESTTELNLGADKESTSSIVLHAAEKTSGSSSDTTAAKDYSKDTNASWKLSFDEEEIIKAAANESDKSQYTITRLDSGDIVVTVKYTYKYYYDKENDSTKYHEFSASTYITVTCLHIGLSTNNQDEETEHTYNIAAVPVTYDAQATSYEGVDQTSDFYTTAKTPSIENDFAVYLSKCFSIDNMKITKLELEEADDTEFKEASYDTDKKLWTLAYDPEGDPNGKYQISLDQGTASDTDTSADMTGTESGNDTTGTGYSTDTTSTGTGSSDAQSTETDNLSDYSDKNYSYRPGSIVYKSDSETAIVKENVKLRLTIEMPVGDKSTTSTTSGTAKFVLTTTLPTVQYEEIKKYKLTLNNVDSVWWTGKVTEGTTTLEEYKKPSSPKDGDDGWTLLGWYTENPDSDGKDGVLLIDAGGKVKPNVSYEDTTYSDANGGLCLTEDTDLYARWISSATDIWKQVSSFTSGKRYLILGGTISSTGDTNVAAYDSNKAVTVHAGDTAYYVKDDDTDTYTQVTSVKDSDVTDSANMVWTYGTEGSLSNSNGAITCNNYTVNKWKPNNSGQLTGTYTYSIGRWTYSGTAYLGWNNGFRLSDSNSSSYKNITIYEKDTGYQFQYGARQTVTVSLVNASFSVQKLMLTINNDVPEAEELAAEYEKPEPATYVEEIPAEEADGLPVSVVDEVDEDEVIEENGNNTADGSPMPAEEINESSAAGNPPITEQENAENSGNTDDTVIETVPEESVVTEDIAAFIGKLFGAKLAEVSLPNESSIASTVNAAEGETTATESTTAVSPDAQNEGSESDAATAGGSAEDRNSESAAAETPAAEAVSEPAVSDAENAANDESAEGAENAASMENAENTDDNLPSDENDDDLVTVETTQKELLGWFTGEEDDEDAVQVLDADGNFVSDTIKGILEDGKWIYTGDELKLYAHWEKDQVILVEEEPAEETSEASESNDAQPSEEKSSEAAGDTAGTTENAAGESSVDTGSNTGAEGETGTEPMTPETTGDDITGEGAETGDDPEARENPTDESAGGEGSEVIPEEAADDTAAQDSAPQAEETDSVGEEVPLQEEHSAVPQVSAVSESHSTEEQN